MRESPRRPIILKRRKLPFQKSESDAGCDETDGPRCKTTPTPSPAHGCPDGIRVMDHPTMPDTQVVVIPKEADLQSVISALTAKGKECGPEGRNKFILLSGSTGLEEVKRLGPGSLQPGTDSGRGGRTLAGPQGDVSRDGTMNDKTTLKTLKKETECLPLDDSLTNIQWLGKMGTDGLKSEPNQNPSKENPSSCHQTQQPRRSAEMEKDPPSERPPYSYMAMIQFAINSKKNRRMTLKEIYNWIEDHFPYFKIVAKPGWKNSIRHNLSLHDMFTRETSPDGKISYWTIRPEANRCLTLDQVFKPSVDPVSPSCPQSTQAGYQQQKRLSAEQKKVMPTVGTERKMKLLLPRTDSYLVPIQIPLTQSLVLQSSSSVSFSTPPQPQSSSTPSSSGGGKRVRIAPKVPQNNVTSVMSCTPATPELREEPVGVPAPPPKTRQRENSSSHRKQRLISPATEEPVLLYPNSTLFDSGVVSDISAFHDTQEAELNQDTKTAPDSPYREYTFKTPIKSSHPSSSTPNKLPTALEPWRITPVGKGGALDFSPVHTPSGPQLTPQRLDHTPFSFNSTPFKELPLFSSPRELLTCARSSPRRSTPACSRELQVGPANRSLTEGLVLDTLNDSLSKILVDISFSGLDDEDLGMANISWSQIIPELK